MDASDVWRRRGRGEVRHDLVVSCSGCYAGRWHAWVLADHLAFHGKKLLGVGFWPSAAADTDRVGPLLGGHVRPRINLGSTCPRAKLATSRFYSSRLRASTTAFPIPSVTPSIPSVTPPIPRAHALYVCVPPVHVHPVATPRVIDTACVPVLPLGS
jgi:hypothetical protein